MSRLKDKVAVITGAGSGIGAVCAMVLAKEEARVVVADINLNAAENVARDIQASGGAATAVAVNIGDERSLRELMEVTEKTYGGLDILFNNAADTRLSSTRDSAIEVMDLEVWDQTMQVNLRGTMLGCKLAIPLMRKRGGGSIINASSGSANSGALGYTAYAISKAAIEALTKHVAAQHGKENIRCNAISPGFIQTEVAKSYYPDEMLEMMLSHHLTPRLGSPEDVAQCVVYLGSDESGFVTGQVINVDGGSLAHQPFFADERKLIAKVESNK